jgi:glycosyltransferase involved in cell wall biosynthesis
LRIAIISDAWHPQINGVVRTLDRTRQELEDQGHTVCMITPDLFRSIPCPTYPEIQVALFPGRAMKGILDHFRPEAIHIATEGTLGMAAKRYCRRRDLRFTTSFHTRFPEYIRLRIGVPVGWGYVLLRRFHSAAVRTFVATPSLKQDLEGRGFSNLALWGRGVDTDLFRPYPDARLEGNRPIFLYAGRVAVEKNIEAFLRLDLPGTKYVVGDGPDLKKLKRRYPDVVFTGYRTGEPLARTYAAADVFVFPSRTDTFGLVVLEAMASGVPVAAYPVIGPKDIIRNGETGCVHEDLREAAMLALGNAGRAACRRYAEKYSWSRNTDRFFELLAPNEVPASSGTVKFARAAGASPARSRH